MSTYEVYLLTGTFFGALAIMSLASVLLDRGSIRIFLSVAVICAAALYMADGQSANGIDRHDIAPAIAKAIRLVRG